MSAAAVDLWTRIDDVSPEIRQEPWSMYWREFKSGTPEFERMLHEPLSVLTEEIADVEPGWRITTTIVNHDHGLGMTAVCSVAMIIPEEKAAILTFWKHPAEA